MPSDVVALKGGTNYNNFDTDGSFYSYTPDAAENVPGIIMGHYGAGRCQHGDFTWTFDNATEDKNYDVITALSNALKDYKTTLVGIFGDVNAQSGEQGGDEPTPGGDDPTPGGDEPTPGGDEPTPGGGDTPITNATTYSFDSSPSNPMFTVGGSYGDGKITYSGTSYKKGVKLDSKGSITFTAPSNCKMTLVLATNKDGRDITLQAGDAEAAKTTVGGTENKEGAYYQMEPIQLTAGTQYTLKKGSKESIVMLIILEP